MKLKLENIVTETDKNAMGLGAIAGLLGAAIYGAGHNIHDFQDFLQIGVKWGEAYWYGFFDTIKTSIYTVPGGAATGYVASKAFKFWKNDGQKS